MSNEHKTHQWHGIEGLGGRRVPTGEAKRLVEEHYRQAKAQPTRDVLMVLHALLDQQTEILQRMERIQLVVESLLKTTADNNAKFRSGDEF